MTQLGFAELGLEPGLLQTLTELGYSAPTRIQAEAIPLLLSGRDVLGEAATGTGKTAAFAIPLLQRLAPFDHKSVKCLVLVPTRELAMQVTKAFASYGKKMHARVVAIYGGASIGPQIGDLKRGVDIVVATPGRALDHMERKTLDLSQVQAVVLDEADEMLDMGFADDLDKILTAIPAERQTALFSATMPRHIAAMAKKHQRDPAHVRIESTQGKALIEQLAILTPGHVKMAAFERVLMAEQPSSAIVFCRTREDVDAVTGKLNGDGFAAEALHGGLSQAQRDAVMKRFRDGRAVLLVATDVAARGLDITGMSHVFNYDLPESPEVYTHRIGRTGRAGKTGTAMSFCGFHQTAYLKRIERHTGQPMEWLNVPTTEQVRKMQLVRLKGDLEHRVGEGATEAELELVQQLGTAFGIERVAAAAIALWRQATGGAMEELLQATPDSAFAKPRFEKARHDHASSFKKPFKGGGFKGGFKPPHHQKKKFKKS